MIINPTKVAFALCASTFFSSTAIASPSDYQICLTVLENEPNEPFCKGYVTGYDAGRASGTAGVESATFQGRNGIRFGIYEPKLPQSGTQGSDAPNIELSESFLLTLAPNFKELKEAGNRDWAVISSASSLQNNNTTIEIQTPDTADNLGKLILNEPVSLDAYVTNNVLRLKALESLDPYIDTLDPKVTNQILVKGSEPLK